MTPEPSKWSHELKVPNANEMLYKSMNADRRLICASERLKDTSKADMILSKLMEKQILVDQGFKATFLDLGAIKTPENKKDEKLEESL